MSQSVADHPSLRSLRATLHRQLEALPHSALMALAPTFKVMTAIHHRQLAVPMKPLHAQPRIAARPRRHGA